MSVSVPPLVLLSVLAAAPQEVPPEHERWLERDVAYIITDREREVFLTLESVDERERFIDAFWRRRDPNPATPVNEFREEHYRRLDYADTHFGRETFREGWKTDRGRFYIILGEPRSIERFDGYRELVSAHLWFYQGEPRLALPSFFYLLFFKENDIGEYRLYHPVIDGPQALVRASAGIPTTDNTRAIETLRRVSPELASASLSLDPSDPADFASGRPSLGTDMMMARIVEAPKRTVRTDYAAAGLRYGNRVSADYTFNFVPSRSVFSVLVDPGTKIPLVHYSIEIDPQHFSLETDEEQSKFYTTLDLTVEARTTGGALVLATDKEAYIEMTPSQMEEVKARAFAYQDSFPLVPGEYTVSVIVRNRVLSQYTVAEAELDIADFTAPGARLTDVVLAFDTRASGADRVYTYEMGGVRIHPAADALFVIGDTVHLVAQAVGASPADRVVFELRHHEGEPVEPVESVEIAEPVDMAEPVKSVEGEVGAGPLIVEPLRLDGLVGGDYRVRARLVSSTGEVWETSRALSLSPRSFAPRPGFVYRRGIDTGVPGLLAFMTGEQLWNLGRFGEATRALEVAVASGGDGLVPAKWKLANAYLRESRADDALALLEPLEARFADRYEVVAGMGFALYLKEDFESAADYLGRARTLAPPDTMLLNALGDSYQKLGKLDEARAAFARSLELDGEQPAVRERLASFHGAR